MKKIITISREYGSGGRDVGRLLAEELGLPVFDKEIMSMAMEKSGMSADVIEKRSESISSKFLANLRRLSLSVPNTRVPSGFNSYALATSANKMIDDDRLFHSQAAAIREIAGQGGCVIVGRCASHILRQHPDLLAVFISGEFDCRVRRTVETYNMPEKNAADNVKKIDRHRANHYKLYTGQNWGGIENYDLVVNTSYSGIDGAVAVIKAMLDATINSAT